MAPAALTKPRLLFVSHNLGGGTERHVSDLLDLLAPRVEVDLLYPIDANLLGIRSTLGEPYRVAVSDWDDLIGALRHRHYARIHLHHIHGFPPSVLALPQHLGMPYDITLHDHFPFCPQYALTDASGDYCGEPDVRGCAACVAQRPNRWGWSIERWRGAMADLLAGAARILAPSTGLARRVAGHFPQIEPLVQPHPPRQEWLTAAEAPRKVLLVGGLTVAKGLNTLVACATDARERALPLSFALLGYPERAVPAYPDLPIRISGQYDDADLPRLVALERPDVIWFPGRIPESYSYTLDVALASAAPIAATAIGAISERLSDSERDLLLPLDTAPADWNDALLSLCDRHGGERGRLVLGEWEDGSARRAAYRDMLLAPLPPAAEPGASVHDAFAELSARAAAIAPAPAQELTLAALYEHGVECGHRHCRTVLKSRLTEVEKDQRVLDGYTQRLGKPWYDALHEIESRESQFRQERAHYEHQLEERQRQMSAHQQRIDEEQARIIGLTSQIAEHQALATALLQQRAVDQEALDGLNRRVCDLEQSTSWRLTAPLRATSHAARELRRRGTAAGPDDALLFRRLSYARKLLREEGSGTLARLIVSRLRHPGTRPLLSAVAQDLAAVGPLALPTCPPDRAPRVSIVIPVYGEHRFTFNCLQSLREHTDLSSVEVIVVDDASPEPVIQALAGVSGVRFVANATNGGFIESCHHGASLARGKFLVLLNNDTRVTAGWLDALLEVFDRRPDAGLVGSRLVYPDGTLQEAGGIVWRDGSGWNWGKGDDPQRPVYSYLRAADYCSGACVAMRLADWQALNGFDRLFTPAYYEDTDLAFRVRASGKRVYYQPASTVVHYEGVTSGTDETQGVKRHQVLNRGNFVQRWHEELLRHREPGVDPRLEADRDARARVLVVEACMITPDQDSGSVRALAMLELLVELGCHVSFIADNLEGNQPYLKQLQQAGVETWHAPYVESVTQLLREQGGDYDLIVLCRHYIAWPYIARIREWAPRAKVVFDTVDLHYLREQRQAEVEDSAELRTMAFRTRAQELAIIALSDVTLVVSPIEQALLAREIPSADIRILSNVHQAHGPGLPYGERAGVVFVGGFQHTPNVDAVVWFVNEIWPMVRKTLPDVDLNIVGSRAPESITQLAREGVNVLGYVPDLTGLLQGARVSIAPLRYGAGVKGKINQAMAWGIPVVATPVAAEGMALEDGRNVLLAESGDAFAAAVVRLYRDQGLWEVLAEEGRRHVDTHFSRQRARETLAALIGVDGACARQDATGDTPLPDESVPS